MGLVENIRLKAKKGSILNDLADYIISEKPEFLDQLTDFRLVEGAGVLFGAGDAPIVEIIIRYKVDERSKLTDIDEILNVAAERSEEIEIVIDDDE